MTFAKGVSCSEMRCGRNSKGREVVVVQYMEMEAP